MCLLDAPLAERRAQALMVDPAQLRELLGAVELRELLAARSQLDAVFRFLTADTDGTPDTAAPAVTPDTAARAGTSGTSTSGGTSASADTSGAVNAAGIEEPPVPPPAGAVP